MRIIQEQLFNNAIKEKRIAEKSLLISLFAAFKRLISFLLILLTFVVFPIIFVYGLVNYYFESKLDNLRKDCLISMEKNLEKLNKYSNNRKYFHYLLTNISDYAQINSNPKEFLKKNISNLNNYYPGDIAFVVWNEEGKVIRDLTKWPGYNYLLENVYIVLKTVTESYQTNPYSHLMELETVSKSYNLLKRFFGKIFILENIKNPLKFGEEAGPFLTEATSNYSEVWYKVGPKISFLCFISRTLLDKFSGLEKIINSFNKNNNDYIYGFISKKILNLEDLPIADEYKNDLLVALLCYENSNGNIFENDRCLIKMAMPHPSIKTFCFMPKKSDEWDVNISKFFLICLFVTILFFVYGIYFYKYFIKKKFLSIAYKLTILFFIVNIGPNIILCVISKDYLVSKIYELKQNTILNIEKKLSHIETEYLSYLQNLNNKLNDEVFNIENNIEDNFTDRTFGDLKTLISDFESAEIYCIASDSRLIYNWSNKNITDKTTLYRKLGKTVIDYANNIANNNFYINPENSEFIRSTFKNKGSIKELRLNLSPQYYYTNLLKKKNNEFNYYLFIKFDIFDFEKTVLKRIYNTLKDYLNIDCLNIYSNNGLALIGDNRFFETNRFIFENLSLLNNTGITNIEKESFSYISYAPMMLKKWRCLAFINNSKIQYQIFILIMQVIVICIISFVLVGVVSLFILNNFIEPINNLKKANEAIECRDFNHRINILDNDEFGHLSKVYNEVMQGLGELEIAKQVQNALLPNNRIVFGNIEIFGQTKIKNTLYSGYYDCFQINTEYCGVIVTEIDCSGIPAALILSMVKSAVLTATESEKLNPKSLLERIKYVISKQNISDLKQVFAAVYMVININDGNIVYSNCGKYFPLVYDHENKEVSMSVDAGFPIDIDSESNKNYVLKQNNQIILFSNNINNMILCDDFKTINTEISNHICNNANTSIESIADNIWQKILDENDAKIDMTFVSIKKN